MAKQPSATGVRRAEDLTIDIDRLDIPTGMKIVSAIGNNSLAVSVLPEVMDAIGSAVVGGLNGVPLSEIGKVAKMVFEAITEAMNPKSETAGSG